MRIRERGSSTHSYTTTVTKGDGEVVVKEGVAPIADHSYEWIVDEEPRFKRYGNVSHTRRKSKFCGLLTYWCHGPLYWTVTNGKPWILDWDDSSIPELDLPQLNAEAYLEMKPSLNTGFSLSNFVAELVELKAMFSLFSTHKTAIQNAASGHLNWSFGWKPFIDDINTISEKLVSFEKALARFKAQQGRQQVSHFRKSLDEFEDSKVVSAGTGCDLGYNLDYIQDTSMQREYHATMKYTYECAALNDEWGRIKAFRDHWGLQFGPSFVWEAIPFSFVVDWFLGVGNYLHGIRTDSLDTKIEIQDFCYSVKTSTRIDHYRNLPDLPKTWLAGENRLDYVRRRCLPNADDFGVTASGRYGEKQILLSLAPLLA